MCQTLCNRSFFLARRLVAFVLLGTPGLAVAAGPDPDARMLLPPSVNLRDTVGIYHWGGRRTQGLTAGIQQIAALNAKIARVTISPLMDIDYNRGGACISGFNLPAALDDEDLRTALAEPAIKVVMATVYDGTGYGGCGAHRYLNPGFYTEENTSRMVEEYAEFTYRLHALFQGTGKQFILSNWEGDNALYCGSAWAFANSADFRRDCLGNYAATYGGNLWPDESIEGMVLWMKARYAGVERGRERARVEGLTGIEVAVAPEFCSVHTLRDKGFASVLYDVLQRVPFDYVSYSAYESICSRNPILALRADLDLIELLAGSRRIILGEIGFPRSQLGGSLIATTRKVTNAAAAWGVSYIFQWNLYDQDEASDYGLFDLNGGMTELGGYYRRLFSRGNARQ